MHFSGQRAAVAAARSGRGRWRCLRIDTFGLRSGSEDVVEGLTSPVKLLRMAGRLVWGTSSQREEAEAGMPQPHLGVASRVAGGIPSHAINKEGRGCIEGEMGAPLAMAGGRLRPEEEAGQEEMARTEARTPAALAGMGWQAPCGPACRRPTAVAVGADSRGIGWIPARVKRQPELRAWEDRGGAARAE